MSITTSDMGHWPVLEVVPFRGLRYARHATGVGNQHQQPAKHRVKFIMPGKSAYSVVMEETSFPALHGTLVKVGGHFVQRTEECEACHKHKIPHKTLQ